MEGADAVSADPRCVPTDTGTTRLGEKTGLDGEGGGGVADWTAAFKKKRGEIAAAKCF
jgi:hypothetical protein